jgi:hypothetical protein
VRHCSVHQSCMMHDMLFCMWRQCAQLWKHADVTQLVEVRSTYVVMSLNRLDQVQDLYAIERPSTTTCLDFQSSV